MSCLVSRLSYRPPYRFPELLAFFRDRALAHVELVDDVSYTRTVRLEDRDGNVACGWVRVEDDPAGNQLVVTMSDELVPAVSEVIARVRRMFDTDSDPVAISQALSPLDEAVRGVHIDGVRVPGCFDTFEIACRAVIGQQISVRAANKLAGRIVERVVQRDPRSRDGRRTRAIDAMAAAIDEGELDLDIGAVAEEQMEALLRIRGIGPWSANYIAMRTMSYPDAFLETDAGVAHALPELAPKERLALVEDCRPWRSYAVLALWDSLSG